MRVQKYLSAAGLCSRRTAEEWIEAGRVAVNGTVIALGATCETGDLVTVDGETVALPEKHTYLMLHKPRGYVTTLSDEYGRRTVAELVADAPCRVYPVGRLDFDSEGLLIMTDDGETANRLMHPSHGVTKTYLVTVGGTDFDSAAERLRHPVHEGDTVFRGARVTVLSETGERAVLRMTISEGKNREIRRMCAVVGLTVVRLLRIEQGELRLGSLPSGKWRPLTEKEIEFLHQIR